MKLSTASRLTTRLAELDATLRRALQLPRTPASATIDSTVSAAATTTTFAMRGSEGGQPLSADVLRQISQSLDLQFRLQKFIDDRRRQSIDALAASIRRLTTHPDQASLPVELCAELRDAAGFAAVVYSELDHTTLTVTAHSGTTLSASAASTAPLRYQAGPIEIHCTRTDPVVALVDSTTATGLCARLLGTADYIAAPIRNDTVFAIVYAAQKAPLTVTGDDAEVLALYAGAMTAVMARDISIDRIERHHQILSERVAALVDDTGRIAAADLAIEPTPPAPSAHPDHRVPANHRIERLLTSREIDVIRLIAVGASNAEIAEQLIIGVETVKSHVKKILRKIGAVNRSEAISLYLGT